MIAKKMYTVSSKICEKFVCEITLIDIPFIMVNNLLNEEYKRNNIDITFGFIDVDKHNMNYRDMTHLLGYSDSSEYAVGFSNNAMIQIQVYNGGPQRGLAHDMVDVESFKPGDKIGYQIDFTKDKVVYYYNDVCFGGVSFDKLPQKILPAISMYAGTTISCSKYELCIKYE